MSRQSHSKNHSLDSCPVTPRSHKHSSDDISLQDSSIVKMCIDATDKVLSSEMPPSKLLKTFSKTKIKILDSNFSKAFLRIFVFSLPPDNRLILFKLTDLVQNGKIDKTTLGRLLFGKTFLEETCLTFVNTLLAKKEEVFLLNGDPAYTEDGKIISASPSALWDYQMANSAEEPLFFQYVANLFSDDDFVIEKARTEVVRLKAVSTQEYEKFEILIRFLRLKKIIISLLKKGIDGTKRNRILEFFNEKNFPKGLLREFDDSFALNQSQKVSEIVRKRNLKLRIISNENVPSSIERVYVKKLKKYILSSTLPKSQPIQKSKAETQNGFEFGAGSPLKSESFWLITKENVETVVEQLALADQQRLSEIPVFEFCSELIEESPSVCQYIEWLKCLEQKFMKLGNEKDVLNWLVKLAWSMSKIYEMNLSHLLFSILVRKSIEVQDFTSLLKKNRKIEYANLYTLFSIQKNCGIYRNHMKLVSENVSKILVFTIWLKDMIGIKQIPIWEENSHNVVCYNRVKLQTEKIHELVKCINTPFPYYRVDKFNMYFQ
ncbi:hypothetical protein EIN_096060 [Entamoeba invadens IP1]|uniref:Ras-GEF domain-containing protein n=1 Tax=Entamoeba invadens IP1 TaxID=370355 RepID=A0A0A1U0E8_ENTIV|nr:hypothetical protein EIN_096060 [Entamoeba invadens IP1]ELP87349.1 hypothetical protein EIN_096060 [Entamoeba invadens IP1]|eukprot:XP_004254120.1 hypothetical protein EIN_096060 [Entamoeba invadens IP1]